MTKNRCFKTLQQGMTLLELSVVLLILVALAGLAVPYVSGIGSTASCQTTDATMHAVKEAIMGGAAGAGFYGDTLGYYPKATKSTTADYNLTYLFSIPTGMVSYNARTAVGWRGPYLQSGGTTIPSPSGLSGSFTDVFNTTTMDGKVHLAIDLTPGPQVMDAWHRPIILQVPYYDDDGPGPHPASYHHENARLISAGSGSGLEPGDAGIDTQINDANASLRGDDRVLFLKIPDPKAGRNIPCDES